MSFKSRQKKRAIQKARKAYASAIAERHYLTVVTRACSCNACGGALREGREMIYRHSPKAVLCLLCAEQQAIRFRTSQAWEKRRHRERQR